MLTQIILGSLVIVGTVVVAAGFAASGIAAIDRVGPWLLRTPHWPRFLTILTALTLWIQMAATICVWMWALVFIYLDLFPTMEEAVYFSIVSFTTLGFGDVLLDEDWRLLSGLAAANGLLMFGFLTAFLIEVMRSVRQSQITGDMHQSFSYARRVRASVPKGE